MKTPDDDVDEILARGRLSGRQYDDIWKRVVERVEPAAEPPRSRWRLAFAGVGTLAAAVGAWLILARPAPEHLVAKGSPAASGLFDIGCASSGRALCRSGETLMFTVNTALASGYLGAYAERLDEPAAPRIWYFPNSAGAAPRIAPGEKTIVLAEGVHIGPEHRPGRYRVIVWTSPQPIRPTGTDVPDADRSTLELEVQP